MHRTQFVERPAAIGHGNAVRVVPALVELACHEDKLASEAAAAA